MMMIMLIVTEDKVKLVSHLITQHAIKDVLDFKNYVLVEYITGICSIKNEMF